MRGFVEPASNYLSDIWRFRHFWMALVRRDLNTRYRGSFLGLGWSLLRPVGMTLVLCTVFAGILHTNFFEYAPFVLVGLTFWAFVTESVLGGCAAFHHGEGYVRQVRLPLAIFPLRVVLGATFHLCICLPVALLAIVLTKGMPSPAALLAIIPAILGVIVLGWAMAVLGGLVTVHFPDMRHILDIVLQVMFYITPIIYPAALLGNRRIGAWLMHLNPFAHLLSQIRMPLLDGTLAPADAYLFGLVFISVLTVAAVAALAWLERRLVFWL